MNRLVHQKIQNEARVAWEAGNNNGSFKDDPWDVSKCKTLRDNYVASSMFQQRVASIACSELQTLFLDFGYFVPINLEMKTAAPQLFDLVHKYCGNKKDGKRDAMLNEDVFCNIPQIVGVINFCIHISRSEHHKGVLLAIDNELIDLEYDKLATENYHYSDKVSKSWDEIKIHFRVCPDGIDKYNPMNDAGTDVSHDFDIRDKWVGRFEESLSKPLSSFIVWLCSGGYESYSSVPEDASPTTECLAFWKNVEDAITSFGLDTNKLKKVCLNSKNQFLGNPEEETGVPPDTRKYMEEHVDGMFSKSITDKIFTEESPDPKLVQLKLQHQGIESRLRSERFCFHSALQNKILAGEITGIQYQKADLSFIGKNKSSKPNAAGEKRKADTEGQPASNPKP